MGRPDPGQGKASGRHGQGVSEPGEDGTADIVHPGHKRRSKGGTPQEGEFPEGRGQGDLCTLVQAAALDNPHDLALYVVRHKAGQLGWAQEA